MTVRSHLLHMAAKYDTQSEPFAWLVGWLTRWLVEEA